MRSPDTPLNDSSCVSSRPASRARNRHTILALARYEGGAVDFVTVLDSQRSLLQATFDKASSEGRLVGEIRRDQSRPWECAEADSMTDTDAREPAARADFFDSA